MRYGVLKPAARGTRALSNSNGMDHLKLTRRFVSSAICLLAAFATALGLATVSAWRLTYPHDPVSGLGMNWVFGAVSVASVGVVLACVWSKSLPMQLLLVLWLSLNLILWRVGTSWLGVVHPVGYVAELAHAFQLPPAGMYAVLAVLVAYLFLFSSGLALWHQLAARYEIKATCEKCGGHIVFARKNLGQQTQCPHCEHPLKLRPSGKLKMSCFFCQGHLEFPTHALGTKLPCPHCHQDITLIEPK